MNGNYSKYSDEVLEMKINDAVKVYEEYRKVVEEACTEMKTLSDEYNLMIKELESRKSSKE